MNDEEWDDNAIVNTIVRKTQMEMKKHSFGRNKILVLAKVLE